jgi:hypothetical protein
VVVIVVVVILIDYYSSRNVFRSRSSSSSISSSSSSSSGSPIINLYLHVRAVVTSRLSLSAACTHVKEWTVVSPFLSSALDRVVKLTPRPP